MTNDQIESAATEHASKYPEHLKTDIVLHYGLGIVRGLKELKEELAAKDKQISDLKDELNKRMRVPLDLDSIIQKLERVKEEKWCCDVVKTKDGRSCVLGHIFDMGGAFFWDMFESLYATQYMIYPVNDGEHPNYQQPTAKERVIAYLKDIRDGKVKTTNQLMDEEYAEYKKSISNLS